MLDEEVRYEFEIAIIQMFLLFFWCILILIVISQLMEVKPSFICIGFFAIVTCSARLSMIFDLVIQELLLHGELSLTAFRTIPSRPED